MIRRPAAPTTTAAVIAPVRPLSARALALALAVALVVLAAHATRARADFVLQPVDAVVTSPAKFAVPAPDGRTLAVTAGDLRLVNWNAPAGPDRESSLLALPAEPIAVDRWQDEVLLRFVGAPSWLLQQTANGLTPPQEVEPTYYLPDLSVDGQDYLVAIEPALYLLVFEARGGPLVGLLDFVDTVGPGISGFSGGDRAILVHDDGLYVISLTNPLVPQITGLLEPPVPGWTPTDLQFRGHVLFVHWTNRIQAWDLTNASSPVLLDEIPDGGLSLAAGERWLASWDPSSRGITIVDAGDPAALSLHTTVDVFADWLLIQDDRVMTSRQDQLLGHRIGDAGAAPEALGPGVQVLAGTLLATDGRSAWLQSAATRHTVDLSASRPRALQTSSLEPGDGLRDQYHQLDGHLLHLRAGDGLDIFQVASDGVPTLQTTLAPDPAPVASGTDGALLAMADGQSLTFYDLAEPASPAPLGSLAIAGTPQRVRLRGAVAAVLTGDAYGGEPGTVVLVDASDPDQPQLLGTIPAAPSGQDGFAWQAAEATWHGTSLRVLCWRTDFAGPVASTLEIDLADPAAPTFVHAASDDGQWCHEDVVGSNTVLAPSDRPLRLGDLHVSFFGRFLNIYRDPGGAADLVPAGSWHAPGAIREIACAGNRILVLGDGRLDVLTVSEDPPVGVPQVAGARAVQAVPNPFNPRTALRFTMPAAGRAVATLHDARGRRVRTLRADLAAGPASLLWDGTGDGGRALPSGTYLVRVRTPGGLLSGRCQLVR